MFKVGKLGPHCADPLIFKIVHYIASTVGKQAAGVQMKWLLVAGSLESAYSLNWGTLQFLGKGGGETLALL